MTATQPTAASEPAEVFDLRAAGGLESPDGSSDEGPTVVASDSSADFAPTPVVPSNPADTGVDGAYTQWMRSQERANARTNRARELISGLAGLVTAIVIAATGIDRVRTGDYRLHAVPLAVSGALGLICSVLLGYAWIHYASIKDDFLDDYRRERIYEAINGVDPPDVRQLIILNQRRMDQYHQMTLTQAADAWRSSQLAMTAGLAVLITGIGFAVTSSSGVASQVVIGSLTAMGSALSGYVTATFLRARRQSLRQLNFYFHQPLATSYLLTAERLAEKIPDDGAKAEVWKQLAASIAVRAFDAGVGGDGPSGNGGSAGNGDEAGGLLRAAKGSHK